LIAYLEGIELHW